MAIDAAPAQLGPYTTQPRRVLDAAGSFLFPSTVESDRVKCELSKTGVSYLNRYLKPILDGLSDCSHSPRLFTVCTLFIE